MDRRTFLRSTAASVTAAGAASYWATAARAAAEAAKGAPLPRRPYRDGVELSLIGMGGIVLMGMEQEAANREVAQAVDRGLNYFDVAPSYGNGEAERKLGPALHPHRDRVFLACKTDRRDAAGAAEQLEASLATLRTDHFDLYQLHGVTSDEEVEQVLAPDGALSSLVKARAHGKIRFLGFSAHSETAALRLFEAFQFDSVLFPVNYVCYACGGFGPAVVAKAAELGVARLALKALADTPWQKGENRSHPKCWYRPIDDLDRARQALRFTLSEPVTAAIPPGDERVFRIALDLAAAFAPLQSAERTELLASAEGKAPIFRSQASH